MSLHVRLQLQFPHHKILFLGIIIGLLGLGSIVVGVVAFAQRVWGHYIGTGLWCGVIIFIAGVCAVIASQMKGPCSAKSYFAVSIIATVASFVMVVLSAGGLDYDSKFYTFVYYRQAKRHNSTVLVHALSLALGTLSLVGNVISVIVCLKYIVYDKEIKPSRSRVTGREPAPIYRNVLRGGGCDIRSSTCSRAPLTGRSSLRRQHSRSESENRNRPAPDEADSLTRSRSDHSRRSRERRNRERPPPYDDSRRHHSRLTRPPGSNDYENDRRNMQSEGHARPRPITVERRIEDNPNVEDLDLLPTVFDEEELPPYEEAVKDVYLPNVRPNHSDSSDENVNELVSPGPQYSNVNNANSDKDWQRNYENIPARSRTPGIYPADIRGSFRRYNDLIQSVDVGFSTQTTSGETESRPIDDRNQVRDFQQKLGFSQDCTGPATPPRINPALRAPYIEEQGQNIANTHAELLVNLDDEVLLRRNKNENRRSQPLNRNETGSTDKHFFIENFPKSFSFHSHPNTCDHRRTDPLRADKTASASSSVSLPSGNPPPKPPRVFSNKSELKPILDNSKNNVAMHDRRYANVERRSKSVNTERNTKNVSTETHDNFMNMCAANAVTTLAAQPQNGGIFCTTRGNDNSKTELCPRPDPEGSRDGKYSLTFSNKQLGGFLAHSLPRYSRVPPPMNIVPTSRDTDVTSEMLTNTNPDSDLNFKGNESDASLLPSPVIKAPPMRLGASSETLQSCDDPLVSSLLPRTQNAQIANMELSRKLPVSPSGVPVTVGSGSIDGCDKQQSAVSPSVDLDVSDLLPVSFGSPTSAFRPYRRAGSANLNEIKPSTSESIFGYGGARPKHSSSTLPYHMDKDYPSPNVGTVHRQPPWKKLILPSSHNSQRPSVENSNRNSPQFIDSSDSEIPVTSASTSTFPKPTPPIFRLPSVLKEIPATQKLPSRPGVTDFKVSQSTGGVGINTGGPKFVSKPKEPLSSLQSPSLSASGSAPVASALVSSVPTSQKASTVPLDVGNVNVSVYQYKAGNPSVVKGSGSQSTQSRRQGPVQQRQQQPLQDRHQPQEGEMSPVQHQDQQQHHPAQRQQPAAQPQQRRQPLFSLIL